MLVGHANVCRSGHLSCPGGRFVLEFGLGLGKSWWYGQILAGEWPHFLGFWGVRNKALQTTLADLGGMERFCSGGWRGVRANLGGMDTFQVEFGGEFSKSGWYGLIL